MLAIRFNPLNTDLTFDFVETEFQVCDDFWTKTNKGPIITGEIWKDTPKNREIIEKIIEQKKALKKYTEMTDKNIHGLMNLRQK